MEGEKRLMCLDRPASKTEQKRYFKAEHDKKGRSIAYKIMDQDLKNAFQSNGVSLPLSRWTNEKKYRPRSKTSVLRYNARSKNYRTGFHIFLKRDDAVKFATSYLRNYLVKKVYFRKVVCKGYQHRNPVIICKEICLAK